MDIVIDNQNANQRLDRFLRKYCKHYSSVGLATIYKAIRKGRVLINGKKQTVQYMVRTGDIIHINKKFSLGEKNCNTCISIVDVLKKRVSNDTLYSMIIVETKDRLVRNKPSGIVVHPSPHHYKELTMQDYLIVYAERFLTKNGQILTASKNIPNLDQLDTTKIGFAYRLDKHTSGLLIAAKNYFALQYINKLIRNRQTEKWYLAIVVRAIPMYVDSNIHLEKIYDSNTGKAIVKQTNQGGKEAYTQVYNIHTWEHDILGILSLVKVKITTGRMHQIRVHLAGLGYPVVGDLDYGNPVINRKLYKVCNIKRYLLHCYQYKFWDAINNVYQERLAPIPKEFTMIGARL